MKSLNILMITHHRRHKAFGRSFAMAKNLVLRGHKVTLLVISEQRRLGIEETRWDGIRVIETPDMLWGRLRSGWDIWDTLNRIIFLKKEEEHYDLVHCFETRPATIYPALFYLRHHQIPLITDWNDWFGREGVITVLRPKWYRILFGGMETYYEEAFRKAGKGITVISTALAKRAAALGIDNDRICCISGGTFPDLYQAHSKEECRRRMGIPDTIPIICFSSGDTYLDLELVLEAIAEVAKKYPMVKLMITGQIRKHILKQARNYGVENSLFLTGFVPYDELIWYMGCADIFILPYPETIYNIGRWPNKLGDYLCLGRPTIANPVGDIKSLFENNEIGLLANYDKEDFCKKINFLIENPEIRRRLGENSRRIAVDVLDWRIKIKTLEDFYYKILNGNS